MSFFRVYMIYILGSKAFVGFWFWRNIGSGELKFPQIVYLKFVTNSYGTDANLQVRTFPL